MTTRLPALCWACTRRDATSDAARCSAFPDGIPFNIIGFADDHHDSVDGDNGLQFEQADTDAARTAYEDWQRFHAVAGDPSPDEIRSMATEDDEIERALRFETFDDSDLDDVVNDLGEEQLAEVRRALGHDTHPGGEKLRRYWTESPEGLAKWSESPRPWTTLVSHLVKFMNPEMAKRVAADWFHRVFHFWPGSDENRVTHGEPPRGHKVGPG